MSEPAVVFLEQLALNTWPARVQWRYGDWIARGTGPYTKRANSVFAAGEPGSARWLADMEAFYARLGLRPQFHVSPASPEWLDGELERAGYAKVTVTSVWTADCGEVIERTGDAALSPGLDAELLERPDAAWLRDFLEAESFAPERLAFYEALFARIAPDQAYARMRLDGRCAGVGTIVAERGWAGFINVATHPDVRRRGIGRQMIHALARRARSLGAGRLYLQVVRDNEPAVSLYAACGFRHRYDYHYRVRAHASQRAVGESVE